jgi:hypothetical protein
MPSNDRTDPAPADKSDWKSAWEAISKLAAIREPLAASSEAAAPAFSDDAADAYFMEDYSTTRPGKGTPPDHEELANAVAEIERASARLRLSEPVLEAGIPTASTRPERPRHWSIWMLIAAIWFSAAFAVASATGAILYLLG